MMKYYIYGAGNNLKDVLEQTWFLDIEGIIDNDKKKIGSSINSLNIISAMDFYGRGLDANEYRIIVSVTNLEYRKQIEKELCVHGYRYISAERVCILGGECLPGGLGGAWRSVPQGYVGRLSADPHSFLVRDKDNRIFRVIKSDMEDVEKRIVQKCQTYDLFGTYIVESWVKTDIPGFENQVLIEHECLKSISFCFEWPPMMYEDYVGFMMKLILALNDAGLCLIDGHGLNATVKNGKFLFYDFGAIGEGVIEPRLVIEIMNTLVLPLILMKLGKTKKAYFYLSDHNTMMDMRDVLGYLNDEETFKLKRMYEQAIEIESKEDVTKIVENLTEFYRDFNSTHKVSEWEEYQDSEWDKNSDKTKWTTKMQNVVSMIEKVSPHSIIDIAGNQGWYGASYREKAESVIVVDMDYAALDKLWMRIKRDGLSNVLPVYMPICAPSLGRHFDGFIDGKTIKPIRESGINRYKSELAIALAIVHHLVFREYLSFEEIIRILDEYTDKYLIVEFVDQKDRFIQYFNKTGFEWYTQSGFEHVLKTRFSILDISASSPEETRTLYLCEKL